MSPRRRSVLTIVFALLGIVILTIILLTQTQKGDELTTQVQKLQEQQAVFASGENVFAYKGKTFVKYDHEPVNAVIYTSASCAACADEISKISHKIKTAVPTIKEIVIRDTDIAQFKKEALANNVAYLPGILFSPEIVQTDFYTSDPSFFHQLSSGSYQFYSHVFGHKPMKYIASPKKMPGFSESEKVLATKNAQVSDSAPTPDPTIEIHAFLTTDCPSCKTAHDTLNILAKNNPGVKIVRHFSQSRQTKDHLATRAVACATFMGKGDLYTNTIFLRQAAWLSVAQLQPVLERYATTHALNAADFSTCLMAEKNDDVQKQDDLFATFGVTEVPTIFVGEQSFVGVQKIPTLQQAITEQTTSRTTQPSVSR